MRKTVKINHLNKVYSYRFLGFYIYLLLNIENILREDRQKSQVSLNDWGIN